jgi:hypothetical protein
MTAYLPILVRVLLYTELSAMEEVSGPDDDIAVCGMSPLW